MATRKAKGDFPGLRMTVENGRLVPAGSFDAERLASYRRGMTVYVTISEEGSRSDIRKWWAILGLVMKQCKTPWGTTEQASEAIKLALGIVNLSKTVTGQFMQYPKSLNDLDDPELKEAVENMIALLSRITGVDVSTLKKEGNKIEAEDEGADGDTGELPPETQAGEFNTVDLERETPPQETKQEAPAEKTELPFTLGERDLMADFAVAMFGMIRDAYPKDIIARVEQDFVTQEFGNFNEAAREETRAIARSVRAILKNETTLDLALAKHAASLDVTVAFLKGEAGPDSSVDERLVSNFAKDLREGKFDGND